MGLGPKPPSWLRCFMGRNRQNGSRKRLQTFKNHFKILHFLVINFCQINFPFFSNKTSIKSILVYCTATQCKKTSLKLVTAHMTCPTWVNHTVRVQVTQKRQQGFSKEQRRAGQPQPVKSVSAGCGLCQASWKAAANTL